MTTSTYNSDKLAFSQREYIVSGDSYFAWFSANEEPPAAAGVVTNDHGPRFALWSEPADGRIMVSRSSCPVPGGGGAVHHVFQFVGAVPPAGYTLDNNGEPFGYAFNRDAGGPDSAQLHGLMGGGQRYAYAQWERGIEGFVQDHGMSDTGPMLTVPRMGIVEITGDSATGTVSMTSNDPDPVLAAEGGVAVDRGMGLPLMFTVVSGGELDTSSFPITVVYKGGARDGQNALGPGLPFEVAPADGSVSAFLIANDEQVTGEQDFAYTIRVLVNGALVPHDPKIIQRSTQFVD